MSNIEGPVPAQAWTDFMEARDQQRNRLHQLVSGVFPEQSFDIGSKGDLQRLEKALRQAADEVKDLIKGDSHANNR